MAFYLAVETLSERGPVKPVLLLRYGVFPGLQCQVPGLPVERLAVGYDPVEIENEGAAAFPEFEQTVRVYRQAIPPLQAGVRSPMNT
jgi:hypothetical protein